MKTLAFMILGNLPLTVLAVLAFLPGTGTGSVADEVDAPIAALRDSTRDLEVTAAAATEAANETDYANRLVKSDLLTSSELAGLAAGATADRFVNVRHDAGLLKKVIDATTGYASVYSTTLAEAAERDALKAYAKSAVLTGISGATILEEIIQTRIHVLEVSTAAAETLANVKGYFDDGRFDACSDEIKRFTSEGLASLPAQERDQVKLLEKSAAFQWHWRELPSTSLPDKQRCQRLKELVQGSPLPDDTKLAAKLTLRKEELLVLERKIRVNELFENPPASLRDLADECLAVLADDPGAKGRLAEGVKVWLESRIVEKPMPKQSAVRETWHKDGRYLFGVFEKRPGREKVNPLYRFWEGASVPEGSKYITIYLSEMKGEPVVPLEARVTKEFNDRRTELFKNLDSQRQWEEFATRCEQWQAETKTYYQSRQVEDGSLSFLKDVSMAKEVIDRWKQLSDFLEP